MDRRNFMAASFAASALALSQEGELSAQAKSAREFYQIRWYQLQSGPQTELTEGYIGNALIPALTRMGCGPVGAFRIEYGPQTPAFCLIIPGPAAEALALLDLRLAQDATFMQAAAPFWTAPAKTPPFVRVESSLLFAFEGWPRITPPPASGNGRHRVFQLRTYESPTPQDHVRKVEMFHHGEFDIFQKSGCHPVFFGDTLIGPRMPSLTYMLSFGSMQELEAGWDAFRANPDWKKLSSSPRYSFEPTVSNISDLILNPLKASQV